MKKSLLTAAVILSLVTSTGTDAFAKMTPEAHKYYQSACTLENSQKYKQALDDLKKALELSGEDALIYTKMGGLFSELGEWENALDAYESAAKLRPNDAFIYISMGNILQTIGDYENAYNAFKHAESIYPEYKYNCLNIANIEYFRKNYDSGS